MRLPSLLFAAVAGLWQQPLLSKEESTTSTRHIHVTRTVVDLSSTVYAVRMGKSTIYMEYLPATPATRSVPWQALQATHLELRAEERSTIHIKVTQTIAQIQSTIFASKVGTSVSTITNAPQSLIEEAAEDAAEMSSEQLAAAVSSAKADALAHSTVAILTSTALPSTPEALAQPSSTQAEPAQFTNSSSPTISAQSVAASPSIQGSAETMLPIGLELRGNTASTTSNQLQTTPTEMPTPTTMMIVVDGSSTSTMTSMPATLLQSVTLSQSPITSASNTPSQATSSERSLQTTQTIATPAAIDTNAAQVKSTQTALIQASTYSDEVSATVSSAAFTTTTTASSATECLKGCSTHVLSTIFSTSSSSSTTSNRVYTFPVTMTKASSTSSADNTIVLSAAQTSDAATVFTSYGSQSSASTAADIAADNAAGASGGSGSFKLSKEGFAAIISVVSIGVGLGSMSQRILFCNILHTKLTTPQ